MVHGKATQAQAPAMLDILRDILLTVKLDNRDRMRQMVLKSKARLEGGLVPSGHAVVDGRLRARFSTASWAGEQMGGVDHLTTLRRIVTELDEDWPGVLAKLEAVRDLVVNRNTLIANVTLDESGMASFGPALGDFVADLPD